MKGSRVQVPFEASLKFSDIIILELPAFTVKWMQAVSVV